LFVVLNAHVTGVYFLRQCYLARLWGRVFLCIRSTYPGQTYLYNVTASGNYYCHQCLRRCRSVLQASCQSQRINVTNIGEV